MHKSQFYKLVCSLKSKKNSKINITTITVIGYKILKSYKLKHL